MLGRHQARRSEGVERLPDLGDQRDALAVELRLVEVTLACVRREQIGGDPLGGVERRIEGLARVLGIPRPLRQRLDVEPLVEQERQVAPAEDRLHRLYFGQRPDGGRGNQQRGRLPEAGSACGLAAKRFIVATTFGRPTCCAWNIGPPVATGNP